MFELDNIDEREKVRADLRQLNRTLEGMRRQEAELKSRIEHLETHIAKAQTFLAVMEMGWHYQNLPDGMVPDFKRYVPPEAAIVPIETARATAKPAGLPTMVEMIRECLKETGYRCQPREVVAYIKAKWWDGVSPGYVTTTLWNMAKAGELTHHGSRYGLPRVANGHANGHDTSNILETNPNG